ncbi:MAG: 16S rRNA (adenine(1518)-N(6)/adenine(1519)-N(6))-dimethyltransferase RsmA [Candidatus Aenigmatarchaeota archaeon]
MNVERVLKKYNLSPDEHRDQIFLADEDMQKEFIGYADLERDDTVLEIGAGIGNLTEHIYTQVDEVIAVEKDPRLATVLRHYEFPNVSVVNKDIMRLDLDEMDFNKVVSNLPYSVSTPMTFRLIRNSWETAVLIYQKEFAERMVAGPGGMDYSRLSLAINYYCYSELLTEIPSDNFYPEPETDSAAVRLKKKDVEEKDVEFWKIVKGAFQHKRKKVKNAMKDASQFLGVDEDRIKGVEDSFPDKRVYQCDVEDFEETYTIVERLGFSEEKE